MINTNKLRASTTKLAKQVLASFAALFANENTWAAKQTFSDFTVLGDATVKIKKLTGTTGAAAGNTVTVAHGVTLAKIISLWVGVNDGTTLFAPSSAVVTELFVYTADAMNLNVTNGAAATTILNQPFVATIIYEE